MFLHPSCCEQSSIIHARSGGNVTLLLNMAVAVKTAFDIVMFYATMLSATLTQPLTRLPTAD